MLLLLLLLLRLRLAAASSPPPPATAYDLLRLHGLPAGLLPAGAQSFLIAPDGRFQVLFPNQCTVNFDTKFRYERIITGTISFAQISALSGVSAQELFLWFPVRVIRVDVPSSGLIYFDVGVIYKQFSLSLFETPPVCCPVCRDRLLEII